VKKKIDEAAHWTQGLLADVRREIAAGTVKLHRPKICFGCDQAPPIDGDVFCSDRCKRLAAARWGWTAGALKPWYPERADEKTEPTEEEKTARHERRLENLEKARAVRKANGHANGHGAALDEKWGPFREIVKVIEDRGEKSHRVELTCGHEITWPKTVLHPRCYKCRPKIARTPEERAARRAERKAFCAYARAARHEVKGRQRAKRAEAEAKAKRRPRRKKRNG
jgi:hypothetical protein